MKPKHRRLTFVAIGVVLLAGAAALSLSAMRETLVFFVSPSEAMAAPHGDNRRLRIGGLVEEGSVQRGPGSAVHFRVTDLAASVPVSYVGLLPDLFREGQGVVAEGRLQNGMFVADRILAKHDENYMPPEVAKALKDNGQWQHMRKAMERSGQIPEESGR